LRSLLLLGVRQCLKKALSRPTEENRGGIIVYLIFEIGCGKLGSATSNINQATQSLIFVLVFCKETQSIQRRSTWNIFPRQQKNLPILLQNSSKVYIAVKGGLKA